MEWGAWDVSSNVSVGTVVAAQMGVWGCVQEAVKLGYFYGEHSITAGYTSLSYNQHLISILLMYKTFIIFLDRVVCKYPEHPHPGTCAKAYICR